MSIRLHFSATEARVTEGEWNKEIVREYFRCVRDGDLDRLLVYMRPDIDFQVPGSVIGRSVHGIEEVRSSVQELWTFWGRNAGIDIQSIVGGDDQVFVDTLRSGTSQDGAPFSIRVFWLFAMRDRKIAALTVSFDTEELSRMVGQDDPTGEFVAA